MTHRASVSHTNSNAVAVSDMPHVLKSGVYSFCKEIFFFIQNMWIHSVLSALRCQKSLQTPLIVSLLRMTATFVRCLQRLSYGRISLYFAQLELCLVHRRIFIQEHLFSPSNCFPPKLLFCVQYLPILFARFLKIFSRVLLCQGLSF